MNKIITSLPKKKQTRRRASLKTRKARAGWLFVLPFVIGVVFLYLPIILDSICYSFFEIKTVIGGGYVWNLRALSITEKPSLRTPPSR